MNNTIEGINNYLNELKLHDWHYKYSDDHSVYMSGSKHRKELHALADIYDHDYQSNKLYSDDLPINVKSLLNQFINEIEIYYNERLNNEAN